MGIFSEIVEKLNRFLYVKPEIKAPVYTEEDKIETRKFVAGLLFDILSGSKTVLEALKIFPKNIPDDSVNVCFHILVHYEADEDIRLKDEVYREEQDDFILNTAETLYKGENLPINIINEYNNFYKETLLYPEINRDTVISRLKKFINF